MRDDVRAGAVVIGRNEGERLLASLASVKAAGLPLVYVDSGSSDGSPKRAAALADAVHALDPARPFSAARARNEGLKVLAEQLPELEFVLFLDGDCTLDPAFPAAAVAAMDADPVRAIVVGHLSERAAQASTYGRLSALEWDRGAGDIDQNSMVGIMMVRVADFRAIGGFNESIIAGEDPELAVRMRLAGRRVTRIDAPMAVHEADISRFSQWWKRSVRAGHSIGQRYALHGRSEARDCARELKSTIFWGLALPAAILLLLWPTSGWSLLVAGLYLLLGWRIYRHYCSAGIAASDALLGARFGLYSKFANGAGLLLYAANRLRGRYRIIEYK